MFRFFAAYMLGAFTFWPPIGLAVYFGYRFLGRRRVDRKKPHRDPSSKFLRPVGAVQDTSSRVEASCYVRISPVFITPRKDAGWRNIEVDDSRSYGRDRPFDQVQREEGSTSSDNPNKEKNKTFPMNLFSGSDTSRDKLSDIADCPRYFAVVRGGQLQLFANEKDEKPVHVIVVPKYLIMIWPHRLKEGQLFHKKYPIAMVDRIDPDGLKCLDKLRKGEFPKAALYVYVENPVFKEDIYFALIRESQYTSFALGTHRSAEADEYASVDLGQHDPGVMARPLRAKKQEIQLLQMSVWSKDVPVYASWLNALLGRLFLGLKDSDWALKFAVSKLAEKLDAISKSSDIIGKVEILEIYTGSSAPLVTGIKLKELSSEGQLHVSAGVSYTGGFKVRIAAKVKLAAVSTITAVEIPVELVATLKAFEGTMMILIKPPPSERIWYCFEAMPNVELDIEPAIYDTQISFSVVTNYLKTKIIDGVRNSMVFPYMQDFAFYNTAGQFYRGGIWHTPVMESLKPDSSERKEDFATPVNVDHAPKIDNVAEDLEASEDSDDEKERQLRESAAATLRRLRRSNTASSRDSTKSHLSAAFSGSFSGKDLDRAIAEVSQKTLEESTSTVRRLGHWVKRHAVPEKFRSSPKQGDGSDTSESSQRSPLRASWSSSTTEISETTAHAEFSRVASSERFEDAPQKNPAYEDMRPAPRSRTPSIHSLADSQSNVEFGAELKKQPSAQSYHSKPSTEQLLPSQRRPSQSKPSKPRQPGATPNLAPPDFQAGEHSVSPPKAWQRHSPQFSESTSIHSARSNQSANSRSSHRSRFVSLTNVAPESEKAT